MRKFVLATIAATFVLAAGLLATASVAEAQQAPDSDVVEEDEPTTDTPTPAMRPGMRGRDTMDREMRRGRGMHGAMMRGRERRGRGMHGGMMHPRMMRMVFILVDTDGNGTLSLEEVQAVHARIFGYADTDDDGSLTMEEIRAFMSGRQEGDRRRVQ